MTPPPSETTLPTIPNMTEPPAAPTADERAAEATAPAPPDPARGYARAAALAFVAGLRSMTPLFAVTAATQRDGDRAAYISPERPYGLLRTRAVCVAFGLAAAGELVGDKLPTAPSRLAPMPLGGRIGTGALAGAAVARNERLSPWIGAAVGGAAAVGGSLAGYYARSGLVRATRLPDLVVALAEDALALGLAYAAVRVRE